MLSRVTAVAAAILLAVSGGSAVAQSRADTLRDALLGGRRKPPPVARYVAGDHAFRFGGSETGQLRVTASGGVSTVLGNTDADSTAEVGIVVRDGATFASAYASEDFAL